MKEPYYTIDFSAAACMFEIRINDYPVITMNIEGQVSTNTPVNFAILEKGEQKITATILPMLGEKTLHHKAELNFDVKLFDVSNDFVFKEQIAEYKSDPVDSSKKVPVIKYNSIFLANVPYKLDAWQTGENLKEIDDVGIKLKKVYQNISKAINSGDYNSFSKSIARRESNMATSMYLSSSESKSRVSELIEDFKSGFKVMPISKDSIMQIYGDGKVAGLKRTNGESALYLTNEKTQEELSIDITFYIPKGKTEFEVI
jgi:hypothetical protein